MVTYDRIPAYDKITRKIKTHEAVRVTRTDYTAKMACDLTKGDILLIGNEEFEVIDIAYDGHCSSGSPFFAEFPLYDLYLKTIKGNGGKDRRIMYGRPGCCLFMVIGHKGTDDQAEIDQEVTGVQEE